MRPSVALVALASLLAACGSSEKIVDPNWSSEPQEVLHAQRETEALNQPPEAARGSGPTALLGVRHDVMLAEGKQTARCNCLAVEAGAAADPTFFWTGGAPEVGDGVLVIAVGARGVPCVGGDADDTKRRPSISAVDQINDDVIVEVEDLPEGRPLASGAIIPKPGAKGALYVRPRDGKVLYAKGAAGGRCKIR